jgi:hypothetical protein
VLPAGDEVVHQLLDAGLVGDGALVLLGGALLGRPGGPAGVDGADPGLRGRTALGGLPEIVAGPAQGLAGLQQMLRPGRAERRWRRVDLQGRRRSTRLLLAQAIGTLPRRFEQRLPSITRR